MATTKISALPAATTADAADLTIAVSAVSDDKATITQIATYSRALTGATTASAITGSGSSLIINTALADSDTRIAGITSANLFFADAGLDKVGIATAVPTQKLDVTGTVNATLFAGSGASVTGVTTAGAWLTVAGDPALPANGDVWYNSSTDLFRGAVVGAAAWSSTGSLTAARRLNAGAGSASSAISVGGYSGAYLNVCDAYNGSTWSSTTVYPTNILANYATGAASNTVLAFSGEAAYGGVTACRLFDGSTWTLTGSMASGSDYSGGAGSSTAALCIAGRGPGFVTTARVEKYNGSTWSSTGAVSTAVQDNLSCGTSSAALSIVGTTNQVYNGSTWSSVTGPSSSRTQTRALGTTTDAIAIMGASNTSTEIYNGSTWSSGNSTALTRWYFGAAGVASSSGLIFGGEAGASPFSSSEKLAPATTYKTFTVA